MYVNSTVHERKNSQVMSSSPAVQLRLLWGTQVVEWSKAILFSSIQTPVVISCCASSQGTALHERTTFAARASSTRRLEGVNCFELKAQKTRERKIELYDVLLKQPPPFKINIIPHLQ